MASFIFAAHTSSGLFVNGYVQVDETAGPIFPSLIISWHAFVARA